MEPSLFLEIVEKYFPKLVTSYTETLNGENQVPPYYHLRFLRNEYSITGKFEALTNYNQRIAADVIALDSPIPLKRRPSVASVPGEIPKIATKRHLNETQLTQLQLLMGRQEDNLPEIRRILFEDVPKVIDGQFEKRELLFLQGFSSGLIVADNTNNVGTGIRIDFGYLSQNQFTATVAWGGAGYTPLSDLARVAESAGNNGYPITRFLMRRAQFNQIAASDEAKALVYPLAALGSTAGLFAPNAEQLNAALETQWGFQLEIIERNVMVEINGVQQSINPWAAGQVIGINNENVGALVWAKVAEMDFPVGGVTYQRAGQGGNILVKKYRQVEPALSESTASESRSLPVIGNVNQIFKLDTTQGSAT